MKFIIEHLEDSLDDWSTLEYLNIFNHVGPGSLILSGLTPTLASHLPDRIAQVAIETTTRGIQEICEKKEYGLTANRVLLLDPASKVPLSPSDAAHFDALLFGGILGDDPPRDRTSELRILGFETRHLGPVQMTTDTACLVAQRVTRDQEPLESIPFVDRPELRMSKKEVVQMPFRYMVDLKTNAPKLPPGMMQLLRDSNDLPLN